ncbi:hypothetical protein IQ07DRAFT_523819, partial [Pyrenochaeta sp. DS3sAY3a]
KSDALKRHWKTCRIRQMQGSDIPAVHFKFRGRRLRACDTCFRQKRACNSLHPCTPCVDRNNNCTYDQNGAEIFSEWDQLMEDALDLEEDTTDDVETIFEANFQTPGFANPTEVYSTFQWKNNTLDMTYYRPTTLDMETLLTFPFLKHLTTTTGLASSFDCGSREMRAAFITDLHNPGEPQKASTIHADYFCMSRAREYNPASPYPQQSSLLSASHAIVAKIRELATHRPRRSIISLTWSQSVEKLCYEMFSPASMRRSLQLFWTCWYPNWPAMHRPSFEQSQASPLLLAAMTILGACLSPVDRDRAMANLWFNAVEEMVFEDDLWVENFATVWQDPIQKPRRKPLLELLQAAFCVCVYQNWEGSADSKRRIRRNRYSTLINASIPSLEHHSIEDFVRDVGIQAAKLDSVDTSNIEQFEWEEYIQRESYGRFVSYLYCLDTAFAIFYRHPQRMVLSELDVEIHSPESCFQAESAEECFVWLKTWRETLSLDCKWTIKSFVKALCRDDLDLENEFSHFSVLNMFIVITAVCSAVCQMMYSSLELGGRHQIYNGLKHWAMLWPSYVRDVELTKTCPDSSAYGWTRVGFTRHAPEYWLLAQLFLNQIHDETNDAESESSMTWEDHDMSKVRALVSKTQSTILAKAC